VFGFRIFEFFLKRLAPFKRLDEFAFVKLAGLDEFFLQLRAQDT